MENFSDLAMCNQELWEYFDPYISNTNLSLSLYSFTHDNDYFNIKTKIKINIKNSSNSQISIKLSSNNLFQFVSKIKQNDNKIKKFYTHDEPEFILSFKFNGRKMFIKFLKRNELTDPKCACIGINECNNDTCVDYYMTYLPFTDLFSLLKMLVDLRDNFATHAINLSSTVVSIMSMKRMKSTHINDTLGDNRELLLDTTLPSFESIVREDIPIAETFDIDEDSSSDVSDDSPNVETIVAQEQSNEFEEQKEFDSYIKDNRDSIDLPNTGMDTMPVSKKKLNLTELSTLFNICELGLESIILNSVNNESSYTTIKSFFRKHGYTLFDNNLTNIDIKLSYLIDFELKYNVKQFLEHSVSVPSFIKPLIFEVSDISDKDFNLICELFLVSIYFNNLKNTLKLKINNAVDNKEFITYILKVLTMPYILSYLHGVDINMLIQNLKNIYGKFSSEGFFANLESDIYLKHSIKYSLSWEFIEGYVRNIMSKVNDNISKYHIDDHFVRLNTKMHTIMDNDHIIQLSPHSVYKIIELELYILFKNDMKKLKCDDYTDISIDILNMYGIGDKQVPNKNILRYIEDHVSDSKLKNNLITDIKYINGDYRNIDINNILVYPVDILKAIYFWDYDNDNHIIDNYVYYKNKISNSKLDKNMLISLITDKTETRSDDHHAYMLSSNYN